MNSLPKTVTRQRRDRDSNPGPSAPESSTLTTRLPSHLPCIVAVKRLSSSSSLLRHKFIGLEVVSATAGGRTDTLTAAGEVRRRRLRCWSCV